MPVRTLPIPGRGGVLVLVGVLAAVCTTHGRAQQPDKKDAPRITAVTPLGGTPGSTTKFKVRGVKLDTATEVRFHEPKVTGRLISKGKVGVPKPEDAPLLGDTQVEAEVTIPAGIPLGHVTFAVINPAGESPSVRFLVEDPTLLVAEKEPNNSFRQAQEIRAPQIVDGAIVQSQDVDVFRFEGKTGERLVFEVQAARYGSLLDSILTLSDASGRTLAVSDDHEGSPDSLLEVTVPYTGTFYLTVLDAHDQGGATTHAYRLAVRRGR